MTLRLQCLAKLSHDIRVIIITSECYWNASRPSSHFSQSSSNAQGMSDHRNWEQELGNIYIVEKQWRKGLSLFLHVCSWLGEMYQCFAGGKGVPWGLLMKRPFFNSSKWQRFFTEGIVHPKNENSVMISVFYCYTQALEHKERIFKNPHSIE